MLKIYEINGCKLSYKAGRYRVISILLNIKHVSIDFSVSLATIHYECQSYSDHIDRTIPCIISHLQQKPPLINMLIDEI